MKSTIEPLLEAISKRAEAATPAPWLTDPTGAVGDWLVGTSSDLVADCSENFNGSENATFIASARTDIPALVAAVRRYEQFIDHLDVDFPRAEAVAKCQTEVSSILSGENKEQK